MVEARDARAATGRLPEARSLFERLLPLHNDLDRLSDKFAVRANRQVGNLPHACSHVALVQNALSLHEEAPFGRRIERSQRHA
jgi:GH15 family glucan-1,4-alpha-glucosidase